MKFTEVACLLITGSGFPVSGCLQGDASWKVRSMNADSCGDWSGSACAIDLKSGPIKVRMVWV